MAAVPVESEGVYTKTKLFLQISPPLIEQLLPPEAVNHPSVINPSSPARVARPTVPYPLSLGPS